MKKVSSKKYYSFDDVLIKPSYSEIDSRKDVDVFNQFGYFPIISANMDTVTSVEMACVLTEYEALGFFHRYTSLENVLEWTKQSKGVPSIGLNDFDWIQPLIDNGVDTICIDVANAYNKRVLEFVSKCVSNYDHISWVAGNVSTAEGFTALANTGVDMVKVGQGNGSVCSTRLKTGIGVPQLTAIMECVHARNISFKNTVGIISDGGIKKPADFCKALAAGADFVMSGSMFVKTKESLAALKIKGTDSVLNYRGMASYEAMSSHYDEIGSWKTSEGESVHLDLTYDQLPSTLDVLQDLEGSLRSSMTYVGANNLMAYSKNSEFIEITTSGILESSIHINH